VRVTLAVMGPEPSASQRRQAAEISGLDLHACDYRLEWMSRPWDDVDAASGWLLSLAERVRPDVVHLNGFCHAALPWNRPTLVVCHSDVVSWFNRVRGEAPPEREWFEYRRRVREGLRSASLVVAPTAAVLREVQEHYGQLENTKVIFNGKSMDGDAALTEAKEPLVLSAGRLWDEAKNIEALARIAPALYWRTCVAGEGEVLPHVHHLGRLAPDEMARWMRRASIYALPARYEPFGLSILEAAASGCSLVLGDIPTLRELWDGAAVFVDPFDDKALEISINYRIKNDGVRHQMARAAASRSRMYSSKALGCAYLFAYQELVQNDLDPVPSSRSFGYADFPAARTSGATLI
jgi:glycogen synthase